MGGPSQSELAPVNLRTLRNLSVITEGLSIGWLYTPLRSYEDASYTRTLSQKFTTDCSAQNLDGPFLLEMNAQWPPWSGATR